MIQRIQSFYLLLVAIAAGLVSVLPLGRYLDGIKEYDLTAFGIRERVAGQAGEVFVSLPYMAILSIAATVLPFVTIFLFKKRLLQLRLCFAQIVLLIGMQAFVIYYLYNASAAFGSEVAVTYSMADVLPLVGMVLSWLAARAIMKDEALVRSLNRIR